MEELKSIQKRDCQEQIRRNLNFSSADAPAATTDPFSMNCQDGISQGRHTAIVVDNNAKISKTVAGMLVKLGFSALATDRAAEVLPVFNSYEIDLLVTDFDMPIIDGVRLGRLAKTKRPGTKVVVMTGHCQAEVVKWLSHTYISAWLFKPFNYKQLRDTIREIGLNVVARDRPLAPINPLSGGRHEH